jgi:predicted short-subunit dehydrogenase-like oxidoreductase (DUF2520 family)
MVRIARYPPGTGANAIFETVCVVGAGRAGSAAAARLAERLPTRVTGRELACGDAELVVLCVPDRAVPEAAARIPVGPWVCHTSGATPLAALAPHGRRFSVHPLQTFQLGLGPGQLDGAWAAVSGETPEAVAAGERLAELLGLRSFVLDDELRPLYHAAATVASPFLVTLHWAAAELMRAAGAPPEALEPLVRRTMENGFAPTGPHVRGDTDTVEGHVAAIRAARPDLVELYEALSAATFAQLSRA